MMEKSVNWIEHKGKKILFINQQNLKEQDIIKSLEVAKQEILKYDSEIILILIDVTNSYATEATREKGKELATLPKDKGIKNISAIVGVSGIKKIIASAINRNLKFFDTVEKAKDWLMTQDV